MRWQDHIGAALEYQYTHALEDVEKMVADGDAQLWLGERSAAVTEVIEFPRAKVCHMWLCGGDLDEIVEIMLPKAEAWAKKNGCTHATTAGRLGWNRVMNKHGYTPVASVCAKELL